MPILVFCPFHFDFDVSSFFLSEVVTKLCFSCFVRKSGNISKLLSMTWTPGRNCAMESHLLKGRALRNIF